MNRTSVLPVLALVAFGATAPCRAGSVPTPKPPEIVTALPAWRSPALSPAQLAKQALSVPQPIAAPAPSGAPGVKAAPVFTSLPPRVWSAIAPAAPTLRLAPWRDRAALSRIARPDGVCAAKPAEISSSAPPDPRRASASTAAGSAKLARAPGGGHAGAAKPAAHETSGPAPATLAPSQLAKQARDATARGSR